MESGTVFGKETFAAFTDKLRIARVLVRGDAAAALGEGKLGFIRRSLESPRSFLES